jgi:hypothetical protein
VIDLAAAAAAAEFGGVIARRGAEGSKSADMLGPVCDTYV